MTVAKLAEQDVHEYAENIIDTVRDPLLVLDEDLKVVTASRSFYDVFKVTSKETVGSYVYDLGNKQWDIPALRELLEKILPEKITVEDYEVEHDFPNIGRRSMVLNARQIHKDTDKEGIIFLAIEDVTDRRQLETLLEDSEKRYRRLFETANDGILLLDKRSGKIAEANPAITKMLGYSYNEIIGEHLLRVGFPKDIGSIQKILHTLENHGILHYRDASIQKKTQEIIATDIYMVDKTSLVQCNIRDITKRKQEEAERQRLTSAVEQAGEGIMIIDTMGVIQYVNPALEEVSGYSRQELVGKTSRVFNSEQQDVAFYQQLWDTISSGRVWSGRIINRKKDGSRYTEEATISPVCDTEGQIMNYVAVKRDITENLRLAEQVNHAQKMETVGQLAGGVAHDFNNMLSIINGYAEMITDSLSPSDPHYADVQAIHEAGQRSVEIVRQLLAFARKQTIKPESLNANDVISNSVKMLERLIGENIELKWRPENNLWQIKMDRSQLDQIIANLAVNARDAITDVGSLTIETKNVVLEEEYCKTRAKLVPGEYVMLAVSDSGCGMEESTVDNIFDPFFTTKDESEGSGLGLSTVYGIVKQNSGFVNVYTEPGEGTTFKIYLPRHEPSEDEAVSTQESTKQIPTGSETILLVEDEPQNLKLTSRMLEKLGYTVLTAQKAEDALQLAGKYDDAIQLVIADVIMPDMNGQDLSVELTARIPGLKTLYMSGYTANFATNQGVLEEGMQFIEKPFSMRGLAEKVRKAIG